MLKWILGTVLGVIIGIAGYFFWYLGAFKPVELLEKPVGPLHLIYKKHVGPYHKIVSTLDEVEKWAKENQVPCGRTFGEFLDNPNTVEEGRLRANCGCVIESENEQAPAPAMPKVLSISNAFVEPNGTSVIVPLMPLPWMPVALPH